MPSLRIDVRSAISAKASRWAGSFVKPWEWRLGQAQAAEKTQGWVIKGNISRRGERIYPLPFQELYSKTKIDESKGERWFCTEKEAQEVGGDP